MFPVVLPRLLFLSPVLVLLLGQGCNWVDSTGRQNNFTPTGSELKDGDVFAKLEEESFDIDASAEDEDGVVQSYVWSDVLEQGALGVCASSFDTSLAANSLDDVCEDTDNCEILFVADETKEGLFHIMLPKVTAPIGLTHALVVEDNDGGKTTLTAHFCIDSVNEAPIAGADNYSVTEGDVLTVDAAAGNGLLENDTDDNDVRNSGGLVVLGVVEGKGPSHAQEFTLDTDGSFTYSISPLTAFTTKEDSFTYEVYDGHSTGLGTVVLDLSVKDDPPRPIGIIPNQTAVVGLSFGPLNISGKFFDPENSELVYKATGLPTGVSINASSGIISGVVDANTVLGEYTVIVSAFDGQNDVSHTPFTITVTANAAPTVTNQLENQNATVGVAFSVNTADSFSDPEGQLLSYSQTGLPSSLSIDVNGQITGTPVAADVASYLVTVIATDSINTAEMTFSLTVMANQAPVFTAPLSMPAATAGFAYSHGVSQYFSDPEGDTMTFSIVGLPASNSLTMTPAGVISGTPTTADRVLNSTLTVTGNDGNGNITRGDLTLTIF